MNRLKQTLGICALAVTILFSGITTARSETLEIVFRNSIWGSAIGGVSGLAIWALQDDDKEDKLFPKYVIKGMALGLFAGMGVGIYEARTDGGIFMSDVNPKGLFHLDMNTHILAVTPGKIFPRPELETTTNSPQWRLDLLTATF
jgi:hypothetical protein